MSKEDSFDYSVLKEGCIIFEPRDLFESAIIEYDEKKNALHYSYDWLVKVLSETFHDDVDPYLNAIEWIEYNMIGTIVGMDNPPVIINDHYCEL